MPHAEQVDEQVVPDAVRLAAVAPVAVLADAQPSCSDARAHAVAEPGAPPAEVEHVPAEAHSVPPRAEAVRCEVAVQADYSWLHSGAPAGRYAHVGPAAEPAHLQADEAHFARPVRSQIGARSARLALVADCIVAAVEHCATLGPVACSVADAEHSVELVPLPDCVVADEEHSAEHALAGLPADCWHCSPRFAPAGLLRGDWLVWPRQN